MLTDTETQRDRQGSTHCPRRGEVGFGLGVRGGEGGAGGWRKGSGGGVRDRQGRGRDRERETVCVRERTCWCCCCWCRSCEGWGRGKDAALSEGGREWREAMATP